VPSCRDVSYFVTIQSSLCCGGRALVPFFPDLMATAGERALSFFPARAVTDGGGPYSDELCRSRGCGAAASALYSAMFKHINEAYCRLVVPFVVACA
jgi:hypothetical protein